MEYKTQIIEFLPEFMRDYQEISAITGTEQIEFDRLWASHSQALKRCFVMDTDEDGITRWEAITKIIPKSDSSLQDRRLNVLAKLNEQLPYTYRRLVEMTAGVCGDTEFQINVDAAKYSLAIKIRAMIGSTEKDALGLLSAVDTMVKRVKPCNLVYTSSLFERHSAQTANFYGSAVSLSKTYAVEVIG